MRITLYHSVVYFDILFKKKIIIYIFFKIFISSIFDLIKTNLFLNSFNFIVNLFKRKKPPPFFLRRNYRNLLFKFLFFYYIIY